MIGSTWNVMFVAIAMGAGMFAQQAAHKVSAASEDKQINSLVGLELFCSAEGYYLAGRFNVSTPAADWSAASPVSPPVDEQPLLAANESPVDDAMQPLEPAPDTAGPELELAAAAQTPSAPAAGTPAGTSVASDAGAELVSSEQPMPMTLPETLAGAESKEPATETPHAPAPQLGGAHLTADPAVEVLPPPAPDAEPRAGGVRFGKFADDASTVAPSRSTVRPPLPASMTAPAGRTYLDATAGQAGRYVTPADLVRERAVARGEQRRQRVETRKWLGITPLRPAVDSTPFSTAEPPAQLILVVPDTPSTVVR